MRIFSKLFFKMHTETSHWQKCTCSKMSLQCDVSICYIFVTYYCLFVFQGDVFWWELHIWYRTCRRRRGESGSTHWISSKHVCKCFSCQQRYQKTQITRLSSSFYLESLQWNCLTFSLHDLSFIQIVLLSLSCCMKSIELIHNPPPLKHISCLISVRDII